MAGEPRLIAGRPLIEAAVSETLGGTIVGGVVSRAAADVHNAIFSADRGSILIDLANLRVVASAVLEARRPDLARRVLRGNDEIAIKLANRTLTADLIRLAERVAFLAWLTPLLALACLAAALHLAQRRRRAALAIGLGILVVAALAFVGLIVARGVVVGGSTAVRRDVVAAVFDSFFGGFAVWCLVTGFAGTLIAASAAAVIGPVDPAAIPRRAWAIAAREPRHPAWTAARALALGALGILCIVDSEAVVALATTLVGGYLVFLALAQLLALIVGDGILGAPSVGHRDLPARGSDRDRLRRRGRPGLPRRGPRRGHKRPGGPGREREHRHGDRMNGHDELCDRRLDEVVFPSTHNSNASAAAGYLNANHGLTMTGQLDLGARGLLIDALASATTTASCAPT